LLPPASKLREKSPGLVVEGIEIRVMDYS